MHGIVRLACVVALCLCAAGLRAQTLTLEFVAHREAANAGVDVRWTVFGVLEGYPPGSHIVGLDGDLLPSDVFAADCRDANVLVLRQLDEPLAYGAALLGLHATRGVDEGFAPRRVPLFAFTTRTVTRDRPLWFDFRGLIGVYAPGGAFTVHARAVDGPAGRRAIRVLTDRVNHPGCDEADLATPWNTHGPSDITAFTGLFAAGSPLADFAEPWGVLDFADVSRFFDRHAGPCSLDAD